MSQSFFASIPEDHHDRDPITGKLEIKERPRNEWMVTRLPHIKIWTYRRWKQIQARLQEIRETSPRVKLGPRNTKNVIFPTTPISGLLRCGYCGREIKLYRSDNHQRQLACLAGKEAKEGCKLTCSKSHLQIQDTIIEYALKSILTNERLMELVTKANEYLATEKNRPAIDTSGLEASFVELKKRQKRLLDLIEQGAVQDLSEAGERINKLGNEIVSIQKEILEAHWR